MVKIDIISGFLGAGKTTLINRLIGEAHAGEKLVLIENEFGEIGVDGGFLKDTGVRVAEMNSGCICCSLVGDFSRALSQVIAEYQPDRILIEPSGVGKLSDVTKAVLEAELEGVEINSATVVVDVNKCKMYMKNFGEFFNDQIVHAKCIVFSHTDKTTDHKLQEALALVRQHNDKAVIVTTPASSLDIHTLIHAMENKSSLEEELAAETVCPECGHHHDHEHHHDHDHHEHCDCEHEYHHHHHHAHHEHCECEHEQEHHHEHHEHHHEHCGCNHDHHHHHHAEEVFTSWGMETLRKFDAEEIEDILSALKYDDVYGIILRAKGIVESENGEWLHFDYIPGEINVRKGSAAPIGKLCVIGSKIDEEALENLFHSTLKE